MQNQNIYNFAARIQCCLGERAAEIVTKMKAGALCEKEKEQFIIASIFSKIIKIYNAGDFPYASIDLSLTGIDLYTIKSYHVDDVYFTDILLVPHQIDFTGSFLEFIALICQEISQHSDITAELNGSILSFSSNSEDQSGQSYVLTSSLYTINGSEANEIISNDIVFSNYYIPYDCLSEESMCNMINFLKAYCNNQNNNCNCNGV